MKKILLSLFILNSTFTASMESYIPSFVLTLFSSNNQRPYNQALHTESKLVSNLRTNKKKFETQFARRHKATIKDTIVINTMITVDLNVAPINLSSAISIDIAPTNFLQHCYDQGLYQNDNFIHMKINELDTFDHPHFLKKCQNAHIDGYSALSTSMLAPNVFFKNRRKFIQEELIRRDFKPTPNDIQLANLIFYDEIIKEQQATGLSSKAKQSKTKLMYLLHKDFLFKLPQELKRFIASFMIEMLKKEENCWLLPGF